MGMDVYLYVLEDGWIVNKQWLGMSSTWDKIDSIKDSLVAIFVEDGFECYELREPEKLVKLIESEGNDKFGYADALENFELCELLSETGCKYCKYEIIVEY